MEKAIEGDNVNRHHEDRPARGKRFHEQGFCFLVFVDGFDYIQDVVLVGGVMTISIFIVKSPQGWHNWRAKAFQLVDEGRCEDCALEARDLVPVILQGGRHLGHGNIWPT